MLNRNSFLVACASVVVLFSAGCNSPYLAGGKLHFDQERYERAEENFRMAIESMPENPEAHMFLGLSLAEQGRHEEAIVSFDQAGELAPDHPLLKDNVDHYFSDLYNGGLAYAEEAKDLMTEGDKNGSDEKYGEAIAEFDLALLYKPESALALENQGVMYFRIGEVDKALEAFDSLYQIAPDNETVLATLHEVYTGQGNEAFQNALDAKSKEDNVEARKQLETAVKFYDKAEEMKSADIDVIQNRAAVIWELADIVPEQKDEYLQRAKTGYAAVHAVEPENEPVLLNLSILANAAGDAEEALVYARKLVDLDPRNPKYHVNEGRIQGSLDNKTEMFGGLLVGQALSSGIKQAVTTAREMAESHGPRSEMLARYRDIAEPDEIRIFSDAGGSEYQIWFYWARGKVYCFQDGSEIFAKSFNKIVAGEAESEE